MGCPCRPGGSVANYRRQESSGSQAIDFPIPDFRDLPQKGNFATESFGVYDVASVGELVENFTRHPWTLELFRNKR